MASIFRETRDILLLPLVVGVMALSLYLLGLVPAQLQSHIGGVREYSSLEAAEAEMGFDIAIPAYFPNYLTWPPASISGNSDPPPTVQVVFLSPQNAEVLLITQIASDSEKLPTTPPWMQTTEQQVPVTIDGSQGALLIGNSADGQLLNGVRWRQDGFHFVMVTTEPVQELLLLARSVH